MDFKTPIGHILQQLFSYLQLLVQNIYSMVFSTPANKQEKANGRAKEAVSPIDSLFSRAKYFVHCGSTLLVSAHFYVERF